jgi:hypothetical protein
MNAVTDHDIAKYGRRKVSARSDDKSLSVFRQSLPLCGRTVQELGKFGKPQFETRASTAQAGQRGQFDRTVQLNMCGFVNSVFPPPMTL